MSIKQSLVLQERDREILDLLGCYAPTGLDIKRIHKYFMLQKNNVQIPKSFQTILYRRLKLMVTAKLVKKLICPFENAYNYVLTPEGATETGSHIVRNTLPNLSKHSLAISRSRFSFETAAMSMKNSGQIIDWNIKKGIQIAFQDGKSNLIPDLNIAVRFKENQLCYINLEIDLGTENLNIFQDKISRYIQLFKRYEKQKMLLLTVASSAKRLKGLLKVTAMSLQENGVTYLDKYHFFAALDTLLEQPNILIAPIWDTPEIEENSLRSIYNA